MSVPRSLQSRLVVGLVVGTTLILAANGTVIYLGAQRRLLNGLDESLVEILKSNISVITRRVGRPGEPRDLPPSPFPDPVERGEFSFNPGEHTYGATSVIWVLGLALLLKVGLPPLYAAWVFGAASGLEHA